MSEIAAALSRAKAMRQRVDDLVDESNVDQSDSLPECCCHIEKP